MADLLPLGFCGSPVIVFGLLPRTALMRRPQIVGVILAPKLKSPDVLHDPALAHPIDRLMADHTHAPPAPTPPAAGAARAS